MKTNELIVHDIKVSVIRKKIKNLYLKISSKDGAVSIAAPSSYSDERLKSIVAHKLDWIRKKQSGFHSPDRPIVSKVFTTGEIHYFLGQPYNLEVIEGVKRSDVYMSPNQQLVMEVPFDAPLELKQALLDKWYRNELKKRIPVMIQHWESIIKQQVKAWNVKKMKTRWGTCNPGARRIWLSLELAQKPLRCLEYVIVHEMVHLIERSHNHIFKACMDNFMPNWREYKAELAVV